MPGVLRHSKNAIIKNTTNNKLTIRVTRLDWVQAKTYVFEKGQTRYDILPEDFIAAKPTICKLAARGWIKIIRKPARQRHNFKRTKHTSRPDNS